MGDGFGGFQHIGSGPQFPRAQRPFIFAGSFQVFGCGTGSFLFRFRKRGLGARQRSGILRAAISSLRVSLNRPRFGGFFEEQDGEISGFLREGFQFIRGQRMTKHGEICDLA